MQGNVKESEDLYAKFFIFKFFNLYFILRIVILKMIYDLHEAARNIRSYKHNQSGRMA